MRDSNLIADSENLFCKQALIVDILCCFIILIIACVTTIIFVPMNWAQYVLNDALQNNMEKILITIITLMLTIFSPYIATYSAIVFYRIIKNHGSLLSS